MTSQPAERLLSKLSGSFEIERELPRGGMSRLFLARDLAVDRRVVVKILPPDLVDDTSLARFRKEIELTVRLQHPHILPVLSAGSVDDVHYYVTPFVPGQSLRERIAEGRLPLEEAARILGQILEALTFAHSQGIVHRDIKPGNVLLLEGNAILADFGIARALVDETLTHTQTQPGTPAYMAPERPRNEAADLYALGIVAFEMLTGARPGESPATPSRSAFTQSPEHVRLEAIVLRMIAPDPAQRFPSATAVLSALSSRPSRRMPGKRLAGLATLSVLVLAAGAWSVRVYTRSSTHALVNARDALQDGNIPLAIEHARLAGTLDSNDVDAKLLLSRLIVYSDQDSLKDEGIRTLRSAIAQAHALQRRDSLRAEGWLALLNGGAYRACEMFEKDSASNPRDFDALFGLGECRRRDRAVMEDSTVPGRYVFRGSYQSAANAYESAVMAASGAPPAFVYQRLRQVLFTETNRLRAGSGNKQTYMAYPSLVSDTIAYVAEQLTPGRVVQIPPSRERALTLATTRLRAAYATWVRRAPNDPIAHRYLSEILEDVGNVSESGIEEVSALTEIRRARELARDTAAALVTIEVRQLLRAQQFAGARALADSALARWAGQSIARTHTAAFAGLAALTGKASLVQSYGRELSATPRYAPSLRGRELPLPTEIRYARADLTALSTMGICDTHVKELTSQLVRWVTKDYPAYAKDEEAQLAILERPLTLTLPCIGEEAALRISRSREPLVALQLALRRGVPKEQQLAALRAVSSLHALERPGDITPDHVIAEAELLVAAHDSVAAYDFLDRSLAALPSVSSGTMLQAPSAAGIVRSMALAARLAIAAGKTDRARQWASAVIALWSGADAVLQPALDDMRRIADPQRR